MLSLKSCRNHSSRFSVVCVRCNKYWDELVQCVPTKKGHQILYKGYTYVFKSRLQCGAEQWCCSYRQKTGCISLINMQTFGVEVVHQLPDWVQIYFVKIVDNKYKCNVCEVTIITDEKCMDLLNHIMSDHKEIHDLHKENNDASIGFQIEFLQLNMLKDEESKPDPNSIDNVQETVLGDVTKTMSFTATEENGMDMHYVLLPRKKKMRRSEGGIEFTRKRSWVWKYFDKLSNIIYRCNLCGVVLSIKGCNTNNMNRHVRTRHPTVYKSEMEKKKDTSDVEVMNDVIPQESLVLVDDGLKELEDTAAMDEVMSKQRRSWVWSYFKRMSSTLAVCRLCNRTICHGGNATGNMNRHLKMLHQKTGESEDTNWVWKVFELTEHDFYSCKICQYKCMKFDDVEKNIACILEHLKSEHSVVSGDQIITGTDYDLDDQ